MGISLAEWQKLKAAADRLGNEAARAQGALDTQMAKLRDEHGCDSIEAAEALLERYEGEDAVATRVYEDALAKFKEEWGEALGI